MPTKEEISEWVREENMKIELEKQSTCLHLKSGTLDSLGKVICDYCGKEISSEDWGDYISNS